MNDLLVSVNGMNVYRNDLVRYYTELHDKVQFGIVTDYDDFDNKLTVSAVVSYKISPVNVLERYSEEEWTDIKFTKYSDHVSMSLYPFLSPWTIIEKKGRTNRMMVETPYIKHSTFSWARIEEIGYQMFKEQLELTAVSIICNEVMEFSFNDLTDLEQVRIIRNLPYEGSFDISMGTVTEYSNTQETLKQQILNNIHAIIVQEILKTNDSDVVDLSTLITSATPTKSTTVSLPYTEVETVTVPELMENNDRDMLFRDIQQRSFDVLKSIIANVDTSQSSERYVALPYRHVAKLDMGMVWDYGLQYFYESVSNSARRVILNNLIKQYQFSNGVTIVMNLPYSGDWSLNEFDVLSMGRDDAEERVLEHIVQMLYAKAKSFKYGIVLNKGMFNMSMFIYGAPLMEMENQDLCTEIVNHIQEILLNINMSYWQVKTRGDGKVSVSLPLVEDLEYISEESNQQMNVYRMFIRYNDAFYRAYMLVINKKRFAGVIFAAPHIYSQNSLILIEADKGDNPMKYKQDYLKYLVNNRRNEVIDIIEAYA